jgi:DNA-binding NarL/FixJ family response regulator
VVLHVAVIDDHDSTRRSVPELLRDLAGLRYDVRLLDPSGIGPADEVRALLADAVPTVVQTTGADARARVAAWVIGANDVVAKDLDRWPLADTLCEAVNRPFRVGPALARALLDVLDQHGRGGPHPLRDLLELLRRGRRLTAALQVTGMTYGRYVTELRELRTTLSRDGLGELPDDGMTEQERHALRLCAEGRTDAEIRARLGVSAEALDALFEQALMGRMGLPNAEPRLRLLVGLLVSGLHRRPDLLRERIDELRAVRG